PKTSRPPAELANATRVHNAGLGEDRSRLNSRVLPSGRRSISSSVTLRNILRTSQAAKQFVVRTHLRRRHMGVPDRLLGVQQDPRKKTCHSFGFARAEICSTAGSMKNGDAVCSVSKAVVQGIRQRQSVALGR